MLLIFSVNGVKDEVDAYGHNGVIYPCVTFYPYSLQEAGSIGFMDIGVATFSNCFANKYVYNFLMMPPEEYIDRRAYISTSTRTCEEKTLEISELNNESDLFYNKMLHDCLHTNLEISEFVEIYKDWTNHNDFTFGPPVSEKTINLSDLLTSSKHLYIEEKQKLTIVRES